MGQAEILVIAAIVVLIATAAFLAMTETSLTHLPRVKALALKEEGRRGADALHLGDPCVIQALLVEFPPLFVDRLHSHSPPAPCRWKRHMT